MSNFSKKPLQNKLFMLIERLNCKRLIVILGLQENQSVFQQDLVDSSSSNASSITKLNTCEPNFQEEEQFNSFYATHPQSS